MVPVVAPLSVLVMTTSNCNPQATDGERLYSEQACSGIKPHKRNLSWRYRLYATTAAVARGGQDRDCHSGALAAEFMTPSAATPKSVTHCSNPLCLGNVRGVSALHYLLYSKTPVQLRDAVSRVAIGIEHLGSAWCSHDHMLC